MKALKYMFYFFIVVLSIGIFNYFFNPQLREKKSSAVENSKVDNLFNSGKNFVDSLDYYNAVMIYDQISVEPDGLKKANELKSLIIKSKETSLKILESRKKRLKQSVFTEYDEFKKITWLKPISEKNEFKNSIYTYFGIEDSGKINSLRFVIVYSSKDWIFWDKAEFLIDGVVYPYKPEEKPTRDNSSSVWEISDESVDEGINTILKEMFNAKEVKYRLYGSSGVKDFVLSKSKIASMKNIYELNKTLISINQLNIFEKNNE